MWKSTSELGYAVTETTSRRWVGRPKFDYHTVRDVWLELRAGVRRPAVVLEAADGIKGGVHFVIRHLAKEQGRVEAIVEPSLVRA